MLLITGGAGFIGSYLAATLEKAGLGPLVICDWLDDARKKKDLATLTLHAVVAPDDLPEFLEKEGAKVEAVFHMGAISSTTETDLNKLNIYNVEFSKSLYQWCAENNKRLIYASSAATYGDGRQGFEDKEDIGFLKTLQPLNAYGQSKLTFDQFVAEQSGAKPPQCAGLKFFNVYGPNEYHKDGQRSVAHQIYPYAAKGEAFALFKSHNPDYPDGGQMRDFVWVGDCCDVMLWLYQNPKVSGLFNLGSGKARSFLDLAHAVYRAAGKEPKIVFRDTPPNIRAHYQYFTEAPMAKLKKAGYAKPFTALEDGVNQYVKDYLATNDPYA